MITTEAISEAKKLWDYHHLHHSPERSDCILVLGSHDLRVAERGAELYLQGCAPILLFSGGLGNVSRDIWKETEADQFAAIARDMGVPAGDLYRELSTNTEKTSCSPGTARETPAHPQTFLLVQKPYGKKELCHF
jgi:hypothetical protein